LYVITTTTTTTTTTTNTTTTTTTTTTTNPSGRTMSLGSTQPLTEMSTRNVSWG